MEVPFTYRKNLLRVGGGCYVLVPTTALDYWKTSLNIKEIKEVFVKVYKNKMTITPSKKK